MTAATDAIEIELKDNRAVFKPGDLVQGILRWSAHGGKHFRQVEIRLGWSAANQETSDVMCHCAERFAVNSRSGSVNFEVNLPKAPRSYSGDLFSIKWLIEARTSDKKCVVQLPLTLQ